MSNRPFECENCRNWYIQVSEEGGCIACLDGKHALHQRTGVIDCHFGQESVHPSERRMAEIHNAIAAALLTARSSGDLIAAENALAEAERAERAIPDVLTWAGVLELPGMAGESRTVRFKSMDAIQELVNNNRRPPEDLKLLQRATTVCREMADEIPTLMAQLRMAIGEARSQAMSGEKTEETTEEKTDGWARARAAKAAKQTATA